MSVRVLFAAVGLMALVAGGLLWWAGRPPGPPVEAPSISAPALYAATFVDESGTRQALGRFQGKFVVLNFWATWCAPCREEMPGFVRLQDRWARHGVQFVGLSNETPEKVAPFAREIGVNYPLWTGGEEVMQLSRRLGNRLGVLPHTALIGPTGEVVDVKVGAYSEKELENRLAASVTK